MIHGQLPKLGNISNGWWGMVDGAAAGHYCLFEKEKAAGIRDWNDLVWVEGD